MGLKERRAQKDFEETKYPGLLDNVKTALGFEVPIEVKWETLAIDGSSHLYDECWPKVYFEPLSAALKSICADDMGKEALQGTLKNIVIQNTADCSNGSRWAAFADGVITLDHKPTTNVDNIKERTDSLTTLLENSL